MHVKSLLLKLKFLSGKLSDFHPNKFCSNWGLTWVFRRGLMFNSFKKILHLFFVTFFVQLLLNQLDHYPLKCCLLKLWRFWKINVKVWLLSFLDTSFCHIFINQWNGKMCSTWSLLLWFHFLGLISSSFFLNI